MDVAEADRLLEPAKAYKECYRQRFSENAAALFDELVTSSGIRPEENRRTAEAYRAAQTAADSLKKKLTGLKVLRVLLILLAVAGGIAAVYGIAQKAALFCACGAAAVAMMLLLIFLAVNPAIRKKKAQFEKAADKASRLYAEAMAQMEPLLRLFESTMTADLITGTVPLITLDRVFDLRRCDYLAGRFGYADDDGEETSTEDILSGEIFGNPFVFERKLVHRWGMQVYTGTLTIHWTTTATNSKGERVTQHHSETLYAHVTKPKPFFTRATRLVYGNDAAPDLHFSRRFNHVEKMSEGKRKSYVRSRTKKIRSLAEKKMDSGFTELGNEAFDALFGADDRDHEVQFRLLFTPLAQKNLLAILKGDSPYGDDFDMIKRGKVNVVASEHAQKWDFTADPAHYTSYDLQLCRKQFLEYNEDYFRSVYFDLAPLLSVPLYQQMKPPEYIYKTAYPRSVTVRETETVINRIGGKTLAHPSSVTPAILKAHLTGRKGSTDLVTVSALSYRTVLRVDYVRVHGGDGKWHNVPVPWLLYIPLHRETEAELQPLALSEREYRAAPLFSDSRPHTFFHSVFCAVGKTMREEDEQPDEKDEAASGAGGVREETSENAPNWRNP